MTKIEDVQSAIADLRQHVSDETAQVSDALADAAGKIKELSDQIDAGTKVSEAFDSIINDLKVVQNQVDNIIVPPAPAPAPVADPVPEVAPPAAVTDEVRTTDSNEASASNT